MTTHLEDEAHEAWWLTGDTDRGESFVMEIEKGVSFVPQTLGSPIEMTLEQGWRGRLSAPGYLDCTDWGEVCDTEDEALASLDEDYGTKCCCCGERVGPSNADAPCDACEEDVAQYEDGLSRFSDGILVVVNQTWTTRWAKRWPCSTLRDKWVTFYQDDNGWHFDDCEGGSESIDSHEAQAMADDVRDIVRKHYEEVSA